MKEMYTGDAVGHCDLFVFLGTFLIIVVDMYLYIIKRFYTGKAAHKGSPQVITKHGIIKKFGFLHSQLTQLRQFELKFSWQLILVEGTSISESLIF